MPQEVPAKLFNNGRSQAMRLSKEFRFTGDDVYIKKYQGVVIFLSPCLRLVGLVLSRRASPSAGRGQTRARVQPS